MPHGAEHFSVLIEKEQFRGLFASDAGVVDDDGIDAGKHFDEIEVEIGIFFHGLLPVIPDLVFSLRYRWR